MTGPPELPSKHHFFITSDFIKLLWTNLPTSSNKFSRFISRHNLEEFKSNSDMENFAANSSSHNCASYEAAL